LIGHLGFLNQVSNQISLQVAHFDPESLAHFDPDLVAHFNPESLAHFNPDLVAHFNPESVAHFNPEYPTPVMADIIFYLPNKILTIFLLKMR
jgi:hypothetical protein